MNFAIPTLHKPSVTTPILNMWLIDEVDTEEV
jgi:hypothetical protein